MTVVAIVDTGVNLQHVDFSNRLWVNPFEIAGNGVDDDGNGVVDDIHGYDVITGQAISRVGDPEGHGTHVAGIVTTTSPGAEIMGVRLLNANGGGRLSDAIDAWSYALLHGAQVINNSWGALGVRPSDVEFLEEVIAIGEEDFDAVFIAAAGNESTNTDRVPNTPSTAPGMLSVGASNSKGNPANFSNFGQRTVDLFAPGVNILSADAFSTTGRLRLSGTSMASPVVAGAAATLLDRQPLASPATIKQQILQNVVSRRRLSSRSVTGGVLSNEFTAAFTRSLRQNKTMNSPSQNFIDQELSPKAGTATFKKSSTGKKNFKKIICVLDQPDQGKKMDIWNELMSEPYTKKVAWPEAFGNRICVLTVRKDHRGKSDRKDAIRSMRASGHFESVEWDRKIGITTTGADSYSDDFGSSTAAIPTITEPNFSLI
tara:strand:+ start:850 stop:2136 length:1287 start_codon:yes stop_codon:yes gene_type:complete